MIALQPMTPPASQPTPASIPKPADAQETRIQALQLQILDRLTELASMLMMSRATMPAEPDAGVTTTATPVVPESPEPPQSPRPAVSVTTPEPQPAADSRSLVQLYEDYVSPRDAAKAKSSVQSTLQGLRHFDAWLTETVKNNPRTIHPGVGALISTVFSPLQAIRDNPLILTQFAQDQVSPGDATVWRNDPTGLAPRTALRKCTAVQKVLRQLHRLGLLDRLPELPDADELEKLSPRFQREIPETVILSEFLAIREACDVATWPELGRRRPAEYWRFCVDVCWLFGPRLLDWFSYRPKEKLGVCWSHVTFDTLCPEPAVKDLHHPYGWVYLPIGKSRKHRRLYPLTPVLRDHFLRWQGVDDVRVVPLPDNNHSHNEHFRRIVKAAGVDPRIVLSEGKGKPSLRKGATNHWDDIDSELTDYVAGRTVKSVKGKNYAQLVRRVAKHVCSIPGWDPQ